jgi:hypothetical protein
VAPPLMPSAIRLQRVSLTKVLPMRPGFLYEPKLDGCRAWERLQVPIKAGSLGSHVSRPSRPKRGALLPRSSERRSQGR